MAGWNNKNCCCDPKTYHCRDGEVRLCCFTFQKSTWARAVWLYAVGYDPLDICEYASLPYHNTNYCGRVQLIDGCVGVWEEVWWGIQTDGTVKLTYHSPGYYKNDGVYHDPVTYEVTGLDRTNWYLSPVVFTTGGVTHTLNVCPIRGDEFPPLGMTDYDAYLKAYGPYSQAAGGHGNILCGFACPLIEGQRGTVSWKYLIEGDKIRLWVFFDTHSGFVDVDYDDGAWVGVDHVVPLTPASDAYESTTTTVSQTDSCIVPPPPPPCGAYTCFPECLVKFCDPDINHSALFLDVTSINGCCLNGSYNFTWDAGGSFYYSGKIGDEFLAACGYVEIWYECSGAVFQRRVKVTDVNGGISETTQADPGACSGTPENFIDSFDVPSSFLTPLCFNLPPFYTDTVTFDVYTNN